MPLILNRITTSLLNKCSNVTTRFKQISYLNSPFVVDFEGEKAKYEVTKSPEDWRYVEQALPPTIVPTPTLKNKYPSEWKPQGDNLKDKPYFIERTKNHMLPVYLHISQRGIRRITKVRNIKGDIWLLERQLYDFIQPLDIRPIRSQVNEFAGYIRFYGDYVNAIKHWLMKNDF